MITRIQARHYRCLKYVDQETRPFQLLVGANASGKTTFLDVVSFLGDLVSEGVEAAVWNRVQTPQDLTWMKKEEGFELAIEAMIPKHLRQRLKNPEFSIVRYEIGIRMNVEEDGVGISDERVWLCHGITPPRKQRELFPESRSSKTSLLLPKRMRSDQQKRIVSKVENGNANYEPEVAKGYKPSFKLPAKKSALGNLPADETSFPASTWLKEFLTHGIRKLVLNSQLIRRASPPGQTRDFKPDGSNLPWVVQSIINSQPELVRDWERHLRTALPDLAGVRTVEKEDDKHRYLMLKFNSDLEIPAWLASDGTLRLLALTLPAYLPEFRGAYLIEEPENGVHPRAVEAMYQALSSVYDAQVFLATHSPVLLSLMKPNDAGKILCFGKAEDGSTDIVSGDQHPRLIAWQGDPNLSLLFAAGVLG